MIMPSNGQRLTNECRALEKLCLLFIIKSYTKYLIQHEK